MSHSYETFSSKEDKDPFSFATDHDLTPVLAEIKKISQNAAFSN